MKVIRLNDGLADLTRGEQGFSLSLRAQAEDSPHEDEAGRQPTDQGESLNQKQKSLALDHGLPTSRTDNKCLFGKPPSLRCSIMAAGAN